MSRRVRQPKGGAPQEGAGDDAQVNVEEDNRKQRQQMMDRAIDATKQLMYSAGDVEADRQLPETVDAVMGATERYIRELVSRMAQRNSTCYLGGSRASVLKDTDDLIYLLHRDRRALQRAQYLMDSKKQIRDMKKDASVSKATLVQLGEAGLDDDFRRATTGGAKRKGAGKPRMVRTPKH